ncbi:MAG: pilus assembly protein, partial [Deltaproteobacteria bacterium]|nr:pilus assembly protein [Deltaproteobacteria bacterium]
MDSTAEKIGNSSEKKNTLQEQLEYQKRLNNITNKIHSARDTDDILLNLQGEILGLFDADRITIYVVDSIKTEIVSRLKTGDEVSEIRVPINNGSISGYSAASGKDVNILDVSDQDELKRIDPHLKFDKSLDQLTCYKTTQVLA